MTPIVARLAKARPIIPLPGKVMVIVYGYRPRKVFESGGQIGMMNGGASAPRTAEGRAGVGAGVGRSLRSEGPGVSPPEVFGNCMCQMGHFVAKSHNFDTITFGHLQIVLWSCFIQHNKFTVMHCTLSSPHTMLRALR